MIMGQAVEEAVQVASAKNIDLPYPEPLVEVQQVAHRTEANHSSMLVDVLRGRPTEIDAINGDIVREGRRLGLDTSVNQMLVWLVKGLEATYSRQIRVANE